MRNGWSAKVVWVAGLAVIGAFACPLGVAQAQGRRGLPDELPAQAQSAIAVGRLAADRSLRLNIGLPLRDREALTILLDQLYDPASALYRQYLTPQQFTERFGPTEAEYRKVISFAASNGLAVKCLHANRLLLDVNGSVANVEKAFGVQLQVNRHPWESRDFFAPDRVPSVPADVPVFSVNGLDDFVLPRPIDLRSGGAKDEPRAFATGSKFGFFFGGDFRNAYVPGVTLDGTGQSVGILTFDGFYSNDIDYFKSQSGFSNVTVTTVLLDGFSGIPGLNNVETALDIQMAISMAPGLSNVIVYEGLSGISILNRMATDNLAKQLSSSWGYSGSASIPLILQQMAAQGQVLFQASADSGAYYIAVPSPIDRPYQVVVGGTSLSTAGGGGPWASERAWQYGGGGISPAYPIPAFQADLDMTANGGSAVKRNLPDVSMVAEDIWVYAHGGSYATISGTSAAAPLWAGFAALVNQQAALNVQPPVGYLNPALYEIAKGSNYLNVFHDVTTGNNTNSLMPTNYFAVPGYDLCTGWGTPSGSNLIQALAPFDPLHVRLISALTGTGPSGGPIVVDGSGLVLSNAGATTLQWALGTTTNWLEAYPAQGELQAGQTVAVDVFVSHGVNYLGAGTYAESVLLTNITTGLRQTRKVELEVDPFLSNGGFETGNFSNWVLSSNADNTAVAYINSNFPEAVHSGVWGAALIHAGLPLAYISQTLPTVPGQCYLLSAWLDSPSNPDPPHKVKPNQFQVRWDGAILFDKVDLEDSGWTNLQFTVMAFSTATALEFGFRHDKLAFGLDDVVVQPVPAPKIQSVRGVAAALEMSWTTMPGFSYQVQSATSVGQPLWQNDGGSQTASGYSMQVNVPIGAAQESYYRVVMTQE